MDNALLKWLLEEVAVIKQAPLLFGLVWVVGAVITYVLIRRSLRGQLTDLRSQLGDSRAHLGDRDNVITFLEKKLELQQKHLDVPMQIEATLPPRIVIEAPKENKAISAPAETQPSEAEGKSSLLPPELEKTYSDFEDVEQDEAGFYLRAGKHSTGTLFKAAILDFSLKPISGAVPWTEVQPQIRFKDASNHITSVREAIWHGRDKPKVPFRYGLTRSLMLMIRSPEGDFSTYERDSRRNRPLECVLDGDIIRAEVRLIGEYMDDPRTDVCFYVKLIKGEVPKIVESTQEEFQEEIFFKP